MTAVGFRRGADLSEKRGSRRRRRRRRTISSSSRSSIVPRIVVCIRLIEKISHRFFASHRIKEGPSQCPGYGWRWQDSGPTGRVQAPNRRGIDQDERCNEIGTLCGDMDGEIAAEGIASQMDGRCCCCCSSEDVIFDKANGLFDPCIGGIL